MFAVLNVGVIYGNCGVGPNGVQWNQQIGVVFVVVISFVAVTAVLAKQFFVLFG